MQAQIDAVKKDKEALQNKTQVMEAELRQENVALRVELTEVRSALYQFSNKTKTNIQQITVRLDHCEAKSFAEIMEHRRTQEQSPVCGPEALEGMLAVCCDSSGVVGHGHRHLQNGCDSLPPVCSLQCSAQLIFVFENCQGQPLMEGFSAEDVDRCLRSVSRVGAVSSGDGRAAARQRQDVPDHDLFGRGPGAG